MTLDDIMSNIVADKLLEAARDIIPGPRMTAAVLSIAMTKLIMEELGYSQAEAADFLSSHFAGVAKKVRAGEGKVAEEVDDALSKIAAKVADA